MTASLLERECIAHSLLDCFCLGHLINIAGGVPEVSVSAIAAELFSQLLDKDWLQEVYLPSMLSMSVVTTQLSRQSMTQWALTQDRVCLGSP